jgi:predicted nucleic acid-binding protein
MIVVDSSVWISRLRGLRSPAVISFETQLDDEDILVGDLVLLEVLQGARDDAHATTIARQMRRFPVVTMSNETLAIEAARFYRLLRVRGVTVRKTIDMIVGAFCIVHGYALLHEDRDFDPMERHLGLIVV